MKSMKRVLSAALALSLAAGMTITAFAADEDLDGTATPSAPLGNVVAGETVEVDISGAFVDASADYDAAKATIDSMTLTDDATGSDVALNTVFSTGNIATTAIDTTSGIVVKLTVLSTAQDGTFTGKLNLDDGAGTDVDVTITGTVANPTFAGLEFATGAAINHTALNSQTLAPAAPVNVTIPLTAFDAELSDSTTRSATAAEVDAATFTLTDNTAPTNVSFGTPSASGGEVVVVATIDPNANDGDTFTYDIKIEIATASQGSGGSGTYALNASGSGTVDSSASSTVTLATGATVNSDVSAQNTGITGYTDDTKFSLNITKAFDNLSNQTTPAEIKALLDVPAGVTMVGDVDGTDINTFFDTTTADIQMNSVHLVMNRKPNVTIPTGNFSGTVTVNHVSGGGSLAVTFSGRAVAPVSALPSATGKINGITDTALATKLGNLRVDVNGMGEKNQNGTKSVSDLSNLDIRPDSQIQVFLDANLFSWDAPNAGNEGNPTGTRVTTSQLRNGKITVKKSVSKGSNVIDTVELDSDSKLGAHINIEFVEWFVSVKEQDVDFTVYLAKSGTRNRDTEIDIAGTMENEVEEADEDDDYVSSEDGTVIEAQAYVRDIEMYAGNGVSAHLNMFKDRKYYLVALNEADASDDTIMNQYPEIDNVIKMLSVNVKSSGTKVSFDMDDSFYVYGADGTYLGTSGEKVEFSDKYYFATSRISMAGVDTDDDDDDDDDDYTIPGGDGTANPDGGGDSNNSNDNPGTGANGFVNVAVLAGLLSLGAVGMTARKRK